MTCGVALTLTTGMPYQAQASWRSLGPMAAGPKLFGPCPIRGVPFWPRPIRVCCLCRITAGFVEQPAVPRPVGRRPSRAGNRSPLRWNLVCRDGGEQPANFGGLPDHGCRGIMDVASSQPRDRHLVSCVFAFESGCDGGWRRLRRLSDARQRRELEADFPPGDPELRPVVSLVFDPVDSRILYAGTTHLPWRTADGGATWQSIHTGMIDDSDVFSIQVDPHRPNRVLGSACSGAYASLDGAQHWNRLNTPHGAFRTYFIALDPRHSDMLFAGTSDGLIKSPDDGVTWRKVSPHMVKSIAFDRFVTGRIFFASTDGGLLVSTDNGDTLRESNIGFANRTFTSLASSGSALYLSSEAELYRTEGLATRWQDVGTGPAGKILVVSAAPDAPRTLFGAGYHGLFESIDGGRTWHMSEGLPEGIRVKALLQRPHGVVLAGTERGLFRSDAAGKWSRVIPSSIDWVQSAGTRALAALTASAALVSEDEGATWRPCGVPAPGAVWYGLALDPAEPKTALAATSRGVFRSVDGCRSWTAGADGLEQATAEAVLFHPTRAGEAFVAQGGEVFRSTDGGLTWQPLDGGDGPRLWPSSLLILASAPDRVFALVPAVASFQPPHQLNPRSPNTRRIDNSELREK